MAFRVRTGRERNEGTHGTVLTFKVEYRDGFGALFKKQNISREFFYDPYFLNGEMPPSDCLFFKVSIKLDLREGANAGIESA
jgi:hypothetical protein